MLTGNCVTYFGYTNTNGDAPYEAEIVGRPPQPPLPPDDDWIYSRGYTHTFIFAGLDCGEGGDRSDLGWIQDVFDHLKKFQHLGQVIGAAVGPGAIDLRNMTETADAILWNIFPGWKYAEAIMNVIFGRVNPSGKLTYTQPQSWKQLNWTTAQFPGSDGAQNSSYSEKHHFGYRYFDQNGLEPLFPFGHGLSYTKFNYSNLHISGKTVSLNVANIGSAGGSEVVQLYLAVPETENYYGGYRSPKVLKQFIKVKDL